MPKARLFGLTAVSAAALMAFAISAFAQVKELHVMHAGGQWGDAVDQLLVGCATRRAGCRTQPERND